MLDSLANKVKIQSRHFPAIFAQVLYKNIDPIVSERYDFSLKLVNKSLNNYDNLLKMC